MRNTITQEQAWARRKRFSHQNSDLVDAAQNRHHTVLTQTDWDALTQLADRPPPPTAAMQELAAQHRARHNA